MKSNGIWRVRENRLYRYAGMCLLLSVTMTIASTPLALADDSCGANAVEVGRTEHDNTVDVKCKCVVGFEHEGVGCVPVKPKSPPKPTPLCPSLQKQISAIRTAASRATIAEDVYNLYSHPEKGFQIPWTAPAGYDLLSNDIKKLRQIFPGLSAPQIAGLFAPPNTAYRAAIYTTDEGKTLVVAFQGTLPPSEGIRDWTDANVPNSRGHASSYFSRAGELAVAVRQYAEAKHLKLEMVGHSLGGALATWAGIKVGAITTAFNAENIRQPGLPKGAEKQAESLVTDYVTPHDIVTGSQSEHPALGREVILPAVPGGPQGLLPQHRIEYVRKALHVQEENLSKALSANSCGR
jgi:hypothetical protein